MSSAVYYNITENSIQDDEIVIYQTDFPLHDTIDEDGLLVLANDMYLYDDQYTVSAEVTKPGLFDKFRVENMVFNNPNQMDLFEVFV